MKYPIVCLSILLSLCLMRAVMAGSGTKYGGKVGASIGNVYGDVDIAYGKSERRTGVSFGIFAEVKGVGPVLIQPEVLIANRGANSPNMIDFLNLTYIELPLLFKTFLINDRSVNPYLIGGPEAALLLSAEINNIDVIDETMKVDAGFVVGAGLEYRLRKGALLSEVRFARGLVSLDDTGNDWDITTGTWSILFGYRFD